MKEYTVRSTYTGRSSKLRRAADIAVVVLLSCALVFLLFSLILVPKSIGQSSVSGLSEGEIVLVDKVSKYFIDFDLGDVLLTDDGFLRLAAVAGDVYIIRNGHAYLNGALLDESGYSDGWSKDLDVVFTVPENSVLLLPDVRDGITGLRDRVYPVSEVLGELRFRILPFEKLNLFV